jgi:hypothetical protein
MHFNVTCAEIAEVRFQFWGLVLNASNPVVPEFYPR